MASEEKLKRIIIDLKMDLVRANIPYTNCPYAYYSTSKQKGRANCNDIDCSECKSKFYKDIEEDIKKEVEQL